MSGVCIIFQKNLAAGLNEQDTERLYMRTALAIGQIDTPNLTKYLAELLKNDSKIVRLAVAKALFQVAAKAQNRPD